MPARWNVEPATGGKGSIPAVYMTGPGIDGLVRYIAELLATSIHDRDERASAWTDYIIATSGVRSAEADGVDAETLAHLDARLIDAWDALEPELPNVLRLVAAEGRLVAQQLDETCGRIGIEGKRAA
jgi:hypothetical protein